MSSQKPLHRAGSRPEGCGSHQFPVPWASHPPRPRKGRVCRRFQKKPRAMWWGTVRAWGAAGRRLGPGGRGKGLWAAPRGVDGSGSGRSTVTHRHSGVRVWEPPAQELKPEQPGGHKSHGPAATDLHGGGGGRGPGSAQGGLSWTEQALTPRDCSGESESEARARARRERDESEARPAWAVRLRAVPRAEEGPSREATGTWRA